VSSSIERFLAETEPQRAPPGTDRSARVLQLQKQTSIPASLIDVDLDAVETEVKALDATRLQADAPAAAAWTAKQPHALDVVQGDIPQLSLIEKLFVGLAGPQRMPKAFAAVSGRRAGQATSQLGQIGYEAIGRGGLNDEQRVRIEQLEREIGAQPEGRAMLDRMLYSSAKFLGQMGDAIPASGVAAMAGAGAGSIVPGIGTAAGGTFGGVAGVTSYSYQVEAGHSYLELSKIEGLDETTKRNIALGVGAVNGLLESVGLKFLAIPFKTIAKKMIRESVKDALIRPTMRMALNDFGKSYAVPLAGELTTELAQEINSMVGEELANWSADGKFPTILSNPEEREVAIRRLAQVARETAEGMALLALPGASIHATQSAYSASKASQRERYYLALGKAIEESKTFERHPDGVEAIVGQATGEAMVYADVEKFDTYFQSKQLDPAKVAEELGVAKEWQEAQRAGTVIAIPMAKYATKIAPTEHNAFFANEIRARPNDMNAREAEEFRDQVKQEAEQTEDAFTQSAKEVGARVSAMLLAAGEEQSVAESQAKVFEAGFRSLGIRAKIDPLTLYERYNLTITRQSVPPAAPPGVRVDLVELASRAMARREEAEERAAIMGEAPPAPPMVAPEYAIDVGLRDFESRTEGGEFVYARRPSGTMRTNLSKVSVDGLIDELVRLLESQGADASIAIATVEPREHADPRSDFIPHVGMKGVAINASGRLASRKFSIDKIEAELARRGIADLEQRVLQRFTGETLGEEFTAFQANVPQYMAWAKAADDPNNSAEVRAFAKKRAQALEPIARMEFQGEIDDAMAEYEMRTGEKWLYQSAGEGNRGAIRVGQHGIDIQLLADADLSTFLHESGHFYLEVLRDLATEADAAPDIANDYATIRQWLGAEGDGFTREQHEQFARGFEAYLMEGKAPSAALRGVFSRFRAWLVSIYRSLDTLQVFLTPEVRAVFDRLLAADDEISAAQAEQQIQPLFADPAVIGMSEEQARSYQEDISTARETAVDELTQKLTADYQREQSAVYKAEREKVRTQVATEVNTERAYVAQSLLSRGTMPDGSPLPAELEPFKLSKQSLTDEYADRYPNLMRRLRYPRFLYAKAGGVHPDQAAEMLGYASGDELIQEMLGLHETGRDRIERLTTERMQLDDPNLVTAAELPIEAMKALHNEQRSRVLRRELEILVSESFATFKGLARKIARRLPATNDLKAEADLTIRNAVVGKLSPLLYQRAEVKAGRAALEAFLKGDFELAFDEKLRELLNHELYRAASKAQEEVNKVVTDLARFRTSSVRERLGKAGGDYLAQIDALLDRFDFRRSVSGTQIERRRSLQAWYDDQVAQRLTPLVPQSLLDEARRTHYKELTLAELREVNDAVTNIAHLARFKNQLLTSKAHRELEAAIDLGETSIRENARATRPKEIETRLPSTSLARAAQGWFAAHRKYASLVRQLDGFEDGGAMWELLVRPINESGGNEAALNEQATVALHQLFFGPGAYTPSEMSTMYRKQVVPGTTINLTKMGRLLVALNAGNEINRRRVMEGYDWTPADMGKILDTLDARDWKFVQGVWDHFETYWSELESLGRDLHGVPPKRVEAVPVVTRYGTFRGGYFPIDFDDRQSHMAYKHDAERMAKRVMQGAAVRARTAQGMLEERVEGRVDAQVRLDFGVIFENIAETIHTVTHTRTLLDVNKVLGHKRIQTAIYEHYGDVHYKQLLGALEDIAAADLGAHTAIEKSLAWVRQGATIAGLGWSVMTSFLQPLGLFNSVVRLGGPVTGGKWVARGLAKWFGSARRMEGSVAWIHDRSAFMRTRHKTMQREINEIRNAVGVTTGRLSGWIDGALQATTRDTVTRQGIADSYFWLIGRMQMVADVPTWLGAYEKQMAAGQDEATAIQLADQAVLDSQGGGQIKDLAQVQRGGPLLKVWTNFYSYFNVVVGQLAESHAQTDYKNPIALGRLAVDYLLLVTLPAVAGMMLRDALRGNDDDDELWRRIGREHLSYLSGLMLGTRELSGAVQGYYGYEGPAGARFFAQMSNLVRQVGQWEADAAFWKALNEAAGILFHYPAAQVTRTAAGINALTEGETRNPLVLLFGPPRK
jgi:hypothetical protein